MRTRTLAVLAGLAIVGMGATAVYAQAGDATKTPAAMSTSMAATSGGASSPVNTASTAAMEPSVETMGAVTATLPPERAL